MIRETFQRCEGIRHSSEYIILLAALSGDKAVPLKKIDEAKEHSISSLAAKKIFSPCAQEDDSIYSLVSG